MILITKILDIFSPKCHIAIIVSDRKSDCYEEVSCHGTHEHHNFCLGLNHMESGGLDRERGQECLWPVL